MKFVLVVCVVFAGVATGFPENRVKRSPQKTIVEVIPVEVIEVDPIPSVLAFDFDAARAGKLFSPPIAVEDKKETKADVKKEVTKRDEDATEKKQREEEMKEKQEDDEDELSLDVPIDVRVDDGKDEKTEETPKD